MIQALDGLVRTRIAQPAVDAFQIDPVRWPRNMARTASSAFIVTTLGIAAIFASAMLPMNAMSTITLGSGHVFSVHVDAYLGRMRRDHPMAAFGRVFQIAETLAALAFLLFVISQGSALWTALVTVFVAAIALAVAVAYVSICDTPPPPRRRGSLVRSPAGA